MYFSILPHAAYPKSANATIDPRLKYCIMFSIRNEHLKVYLPAVVYFKLKWPFLSRKFLGITSTAL